MVYIVVILLSLIIGVGGGYGVFVFTKPEAKTTESPATPTNKAEEHMTKTSTQNIYDTDMNDFAKLNEGLTRESAMVFLEVRSHLVGIPENKQKEMIKSFEKMADKLPIIEAFKIIALQYHLMSFADFRDSKM